MHTWNEKNVNLTLLAKLKNQHILINMSPVVASQELQKELNKYPLISKDFEEVLDNIDKMNQNQFDLNKRIENLKIKLKKHKNSLSVTEYNKERAVFEYLRRLSNNDRKGKIKASVETAQA